MTPQLSRPMAVNAATPMAPVAGRVPVRLRNATGVSSFPLRGWPAALVGTLFLAAGAAPAAMVVASLAVARREGAGPEALLRPALGLLVALLFAAVGIGILAVAVRDLRQGRVARARRAQYPEQPWLWDFPWERRGGMDESRRRLGQALMFGTLVTVLGLPLLLAGSGGLLTVIPLGFLIGGGGWVAYEVARRRRWGTSRLRFARFPVHPGGTLDVALDALSPAVRAMPLEVTLRCVQERYETRRASRNRTELAVAYWELWRADVAVPAGMSALSIPIPDGVPGSELGIRPARYWELELRAEVPGVDYRASFLVPVYATA